MNSKNTWLLLALAALLAGFIFVWEKYVAGPARAALDLFAADEVADIAHHHSSCP